jgi:hypothetical protein
MLKDWTALHAQMFRIGLPTQLGVFSFAPNRGYFLPWKYPKSS